MKKFALFIGAIVIIAVVIILFFYLPDKTVTGDVVVIPPASNISCAGVFECNSTDCVCTIAKNYSLTCQKREAFNTFWHEAPCSIRNCGKMNQYIDCQTKFENETQYFQDFCERIREYKTDCLPAPLCNSTFVETKRTEC